MKYEIKTEINKSDRLGLPHTLYMFAIDENGDRELVEGVSVDCRKKLMMLEEEYRQVYNIGETQ